MAIKAAVFDRPITVLDMPESTALGAAILGGLAAGVFPDIDGALAGLTTDETEISPDALLATAYARRYESVYRTLRTATTDLHGAIGEVENRG